jgi:hypothetical protein
MSLLIDIFLIVSFSSLGFLFYFISYFLFLVLCFWVCKPGLETGINSISFLDQLCRS